MGLQKLAKFPERFWAKNLQSEFEKIGGLVTLEGNVDITRTSKEKNITDHAAYIIKHWIRVKDAEIEDLSSRPVWLKKDFCTARGTSLRSFRLAKLGFRQISDFFDYDGRLIWG